jgi:hypothetical protein
LGGTAAQPITIIASARGFNEMRNHLLSLIIAAALVVAFVAPAANAADTAEAATMEMASAAPSTAGDQVSAATLPAYLDKEMVAKHADFSQFARSKVRSLNQNNKLSRSRMQIERLSDGSYRARYHSIDDASLVCKVRRSKSTSVPYVGVLSYKEKIFEAVAGSPDACRTAEFIPVAVIPNRHIFSFKQGSWQ